MPASGHANNLVPLMRYRDVGVASEWLRAAFGFENHFCAKAPDGSIFYAELRLGDGMVMLGAVGEPSLDALMRQPDEVGAAQTQSCYVVVEDTEGHYERSKRAGAEIVLDLKSDDMGGRGYSCRDLEGHVWNFGTYNPWTAQSQSPSGNALSSTASTAKTSRALRAAMLATLAGSMATGWWIYGDVRSAVGGISIAQVREKLLGERAKPSSPLATGTIDATGAEARAARQEAEQAQAEIARAQIAMNALKDELHRERAAKDAAIGAASAARAEAARTAAGLAEKMKADAEHAEALRTQAGHAATTTAETARTETALADLRDELARERSAKETALKSVADTQAELARERDATAGAMKAAGAAETRFAAVNAANEVLRRDVDSLRTRVAAIEKDDNAPPETSAGKVVPPASTPSVKLRNQRAAVAARRRTRKNPTSYAVPKSWPYDTW